MKTCPKCGAFFTLEDILSNELVCPIGMSFEESDHDLNLYYFTHIAPECGSTFTIPAIEFLSLIDEPVGSASLFGGPECRGHCSQTDELRTCNSECKWAPFRRFLLHLIERRKQPCPKLNRPL